MRRAGIASIALTLGLFLVCAQPAFATFHEMMVREVYPGSAAQPDSEYVELQMWSPGQNFVGGHALGFYGALGASLGTATFPHDVTGDANQSTLVAATPAAEAEFGFTADAGLAPGLMDPAGGAVCWESLDCVSWGSFGGSAKSPTGQPVAPAGIPDGMALRRTIAPGCATLLEPSDDHDNSAVDFSTAFPSPRPNSVPPSERPCELGTGSGPGGSGGGVATGQQGQSGGRAPQTTFKRKPAKNSHDRTPTFRFGSDQAGARFECKLDGSRFKPCHSPFTVHRLGLGGHTFEVRARGSSGKADPSPSAYGFRVTPRPR